MEYCAKRQIYAHSKSYETLDGNPSACGYGPEAFAQISEKGQVPVEQSPHENPVPPMVGILIRPGDQMTLVPGNLILQSSQCLSPNNGNLWDL